MALLTPLAFEEARSLSAHFGLDLVGLVPLAAGSVNSNFFLETERGRFFARIYEEQGKEGAAFELELNAVLSKNGVPVARPLRPLQEGARLEVAGKPFAIYECLSGSSPCTAMVTPAMARSLGAALARVHGANLGSLSLPDGRFGANGLRERLLIVEQSGRAELARAAGEIRTLLARLEIERSQSLPTGLVHGDLFRDNVLVAGDEVTGLLDFESASRGNFVYDLMVTMLAWCFGDSFRIDCARALVEGYQSLRPLEESEKRAMKAEGLFACARFATTRLTDFSLRVPDGEKPVRDYRRFFARRDEIEAGLVDRLF